MPIKYKNTCCEYYDNLNGYFCRICGSSVQFNDKARARISQTYTTDEKYCDQCGNGRHDGNGTCKPKKDIKY